jgi:hypothetical protein
MADENSKTQSPDQDIAFHSVPLDPALADELGLSIYQSIQMGLGAREGLDDAIEYWRDLAEMVTMERDDPWPNAASVSAGVTAKTLNDVRSRLMAAVMVKTPYVVSGKSDIAAGNQEQVARYYNALFYTKPFHQAHDDAIHLSLLDGTSYVYVPWVKQIAYRTMVEKIAVNNPDGTPATDAKGKQKYKTTKRKAKIVEYNGVKPEAVELADLVLIPVTAKSAEDAAATAQRCWFYEQELWDMVASGDMYKDAVQEVLDYGPPGYNEQTQLWRRSTYEMNGMISITDTATDVGTGLKQRGPFMFWRYITTEYDLDGDGNYERNVAYIHDASKILCGIGPYQYWHGQSPYIEVWAGLPRPGRAYGRGIPELTRTYDEEASAMDNQRLDLIDLLLQAPRYHKRNVKIETQQQGWGPNVDYEVDDKEDVGLLMQGYQVPVVSFEEQQLLEAKAAQLCGVATPGQATQGGQKISAKQASAWQMSQNVIIDLMAMNVRWAMKKVLDQTHFLTLQYGYNDDDEDTETAGAVMQQGQNLKPDFDVLGADGGNGYELDVTGLAGGLDQDAQFQKTMTAYSLLRQDPLVSGDLSKWWYVVKMVLEGLGREDIPKIIGTQEDAANKQKQMEQAAQQKEEREFQLQIASHSKNPPPKQGGGSAPPQGAQHPPQMGGPQLGAA